VSRLFVALPLCFFFFCTCKIKNNSIKKRFYNNFEAIFMNIINSYYMVLFINIIHTVI